MSAEQALEMIRKREKGEGDSFLERFLSDLFRLFDGHLPPSLEPEVNILLSLIAK